MIFAIGLTEWFHLLAPVLCGLVGLIAGSLATRSLITTRYQAKARGFLVIEPDNAGALVDIGEIPKEVVGKLKEGDIVELQVRRMDILEYTGRKEHGKDK